MKNSKRRVLFGAIIGCAFAGAAHASQVEVQIRKNVSDTNPPILQIYDPLHKLEYDRGETIPVAAGSRKVNRLSIGSGTAAPFDIIAQTSSTSSGTSKRTTHVGALYSGLSMFAIGAPQSDGDVRNSPTPLDALFGNAKTVMISVPYQLTLTPTPATDLGALIKAHFTLAAQILKSDGFAKADRVLATKSGTVTLANDGTSTKSGFFASKTVTRGVTKKYNLDLNFLLDRDSDFLSIPYRSNGLLRFSATLDLTSVGPSKTSSATAELSWPDEPMVKIDGSQRIPFFTLVDDNGGFIQANQLPVFVPEPSSVIVFASTGLAVGGAMWLRYKRRHAASHLGQAIS